MDKKARLIVLDVETYRTRNPVMVERIRREAIEKRPASNTRKDLKTMWDTAAAREARAREALAKTAADVLFAEVLCVCWRADGEAFNLSAMDQRCVQAQTEDSDELELLALEMLAEHWRAQAGPETIWVGHNVLGFDLGVLLNRWRRYGISPPEHFPSYVNGRWRGRVFDTMTRTPCKNGIGLVSLEDVCAAYDIASATPIEWRGEPMTGSRVGAAFEGGEYDVVLEYSALDVQTTERLYMLMTCDGMWGTFDAHHAVAEQIAEIKGSEISESAKALAIVDVLDRAGLIPRVA